MGTRCSSCVPPIRLHGMQCSCLFSACMSIRQYNVLVLDLVPVAATGGGGAAPDAMNCNQCITGFPDTPQRLAHMATSIGVHQSKHCSLGPNEHTPAECLLARKRRVARVRGHLALSRVGLVGGGVRAVLWCWRGGRAATGSETCC